MFTAETSDGGYDNEISHGNVSLARSKGCDISQQCMCCLWLVSAFLFALVFAARSNLLLCCQTSSQAQLLLLLLLLFAIT